MKLNPQSKPPGEEKLSRAWTIPLGAAHVGTRLNPTDSTAERKWPDEGMFGQNLARRILDGQVGSRNWDGQCCYSTMQEARNAVY